MKLVVLEALVVLDGPDLIPTVHGTVLGVVMVKRERKRTGSRNNSADPVVEKENLKQ